MASGSASAERIRMAKSEKDATFWQSLASANFYKRNQGRMTRQLTAGAILLAVALGAWAMYVSVLADLAPAVRYGIAGAVAAVGAWFAFRIINYPIFADFLVDVEGEMAKVSWPNQGELKRATAVVLVVMLLLSAVLFGYDVIWQQVLKSIGILQF
jgi:preprotein translocase subunit SecE